MRDRITKLVKAFIVFLLLISLTPVFNKNVEADDGWTEITSLATTADLVDFVIDPNLIGADPNSTYTGHLRIGPPVTNQVGNVLNTASYYITRTNSDGSSDRITYAYFSNNFSTSYSTLYYLNSSTGAINATDNRFLHGIMIFSVWTKERVPGYNMLQLRGTYSNGPNGQPLEVYITMIPYENGLVVHNIEIINNGTEAIDIGFVRTFDTDLTINGITNDDVPVYSLGTNQGMYIENEAKNARVMFPYILPSKNGPDDYKAARYSLANPFGTGFNTPGEINISRTLGDVLLQDTDTGIFFLWNLKTLEPGQSRIFSYGVSLSSTSALDVPIITSVSSPATVKRNKTFTAEVTWQDFDSTSQELYYMLDGEAVGTLFNTSSDDPIAFSMPVSSLTLGTHTLDFYVIDPDTNVSNIYQISFEVLAEDTFTLTYDLNGGNAGSGPAVESGLINGTYPVDSTTIPTHPGDSGKAVAFIGWTASQDLNIYDFGDTGLPALLSTVEIDDDNATVWALWGYDGNNDGKPDVDEVAYTVQYFYDGVLDPSLTYTDIASVGDLITGVNIPSQLKSGFELDSIGSLYTTIVADENDNIISVYYVTAQYPDTGDVDTKAIIGLTVAMGALILCVIRKKENAE